MSVPNPTRRAVVALGGNAITRPGEEGTVAQDLANLERSLEAVVELLDRGYEPDIPWYGAVRMTSLDEVNRALGIA